MVLQKGVSYCPIPGPPDDGTLSDDFPKFHRRLQCAQFFYTEEPKDKTLPLQSQAEDLSLLPFKHPLFKNKSEWQPPPNINVESLSAIK